MTTKYVRLRGIGVWIWPVTGDREHLSENCDYISIRSVTMPSAVQTVIHIDKRKIEVEPPIKSLGPHEVTVQLHTEVTETLRVVVAAQ